MAGSFERTAGRTNGGSSGGRRAPATSGGIYYTSAEVNANRQQESANHDAGNSLLADMIRLTVKILGWFDLNRHVVGAANGPPTDFATLGMHDEVGELK